MSHRKIGRRELIGALGASGAAVAFGCGSSAASPTSPTTTTITTTSSNAACAVTPTETIGPYPNLVDLFRSDIREGKSGTLLALTIKVVNVANACAPVGGASVEIWQCDAGGNYSEYGTQATQTYLRGIQTANDNGEVTFITIASRGSNPTTNLSDGIFADSLSSELVTPAGDPTNGYTAAFQIGIAL